MALVKDFVFAVLAALALSSVAQDSDVPFVVAARQFGARGLGVEIVPELVEKSRDNARRAGVADRVEFRVQDLFATDLSSATVITVDAPDKPIGRDKVSRLYLWTVPAR